MRVPTAVRRVEAVPARGLGLPRAVVEERGRWSATVAVGTGGALFRRLRGDSLGRCEQVDGSQVMCSIFPVFFVAASYNINKISFLYRIKI